MAKPNAKRNLPPVRSYGIFRVIDGGAAADRPRFVSEALQDLVKTLAREAARAAASDHLIEKYVGGAGKDHPSRKADFALWTERRERWQTAAWALAAYVAENIHEARLKATAVRFDCNGEVATSLARDICHLFWSVE